MNITKKDFEKVSEEIKKEAVKKAMEELRQKMEIIMVEVRKRKIDGNYVSQTIAEAYGLGVETMNKKINQIYKEWGIE